MKLRICYEQEELSNLMRHAQATHITITLEPREFVASLVIREPLLDPGYYCYAPDGGSTPYFRAGSRSLHHGGPTWFPTLYEAWDAATKMGFEVVMTKRQREEEDARLRALLGNLYDPGYLIDDILPRSGSSLGEVVNTSIPAVASGGKVHSRSHGDL